MAGPLSNLFGSGSDSQPHSDNAVVPASTLDQSDGDDTGGDGAQGAFAVHEPAYDSDYSSVADSGDPGAPSGGWIEAQDGQADAM